MGKNRKNHYKRIHLLYFSEKENDLIYNGMTYFSLNVMVLLGI